MCDFVSGIIREKDEAILFYDASSHHETANHFNLVGDSYREFEWTKNDKGESLVVRVPPKHDKNESWYKSLILSKWKTREELIDSLSEEVKKLAVEQNGHVIQYIKNPTEEIKKLAVEQYGCAIQYIKNPSEEIKKLTVE